MGTATKTYKRLTACIGAAALLVALVLAMAPGKQADAANGSDQLMAATPEKAQTLKTQALQSQAWKKLTVKPGIYFIQSQLDGTYMLDVDGASKKNGANVQLYSYNGTKAQLWRITKNSDGSYRIRNVRSGKSLDIEGGSIDNNSNVQQYKNNGTKAQRWTFRKKGDACYIMPAANPAYALDALNGKAANSTNVQIYSLNRSAAQRWWLVPIKKKPASQRTVKDGLYEMRLTSASSYVVDSSSDRITNGVNVELNKRDSSMSQRWYIKWGADGYYTVRNVSTGKLLDVQDDSFAVKTNVQTWAANGTDAQHWAISKNSDGSFVLRCKASGLALDAAGARAANGTNVRMMAATNGPSQRFTLKRLTSAVPRGVYVMYTMLAPLKSAVDIPDDSKKNNAQAQLYSANGSMTERFYLRPVKGNAYGIQSASSGKYLTDANGKAVQRKRANSKSQQWAIGADGNGLTFTNMATGKRLAVASSSTENGTKLITTRNAVNNAQCFHLASTRLVPDGYYLFGNAASGKRLDVDGGSLTDKANVQVYNMNKTAAQVWKVSYASDGYYKILNDGSSKALDVEGASKDAKANVWQYTPNNSAAQLWRPELRVDGAITFVNKGSSMALEAAGTKSGANVRQNAKFNKSTQGWYLYSTSSRSLSGNTELDTFIRKIVDDNNGSLKNCFNWLKDNVTRVNSIGTAPATGIIAKQASIDGALYAFKNKKADSYYFASACKWLAIGCGYSAEARSGQISTTTETPSNHGWTEINQSGQTYICDVDLAISIGGTYKWCLTTYETAPVQYYR